MESSSARITLRHSFGTLLSELFGGGIPFSGLTEPQTVMSIMNGESLILLSPATRAEARPLLEMCWQMDASKRPSFDAIIDVLKGMKLSSPMLPAQVCNVYFHHTTATDVSYSEAL